MPETPYKEFRADGWPYCPVCEEDELYSCVMLAYRGQGERPTIEECIAGEMACYLCGWNSWRAKHAAVIAAVQESEGWPTEL